MSNLESDLQAAGPKEPVIKSSHMPRLNLRELPYGLALILTLFGVAYNRSDNAWDCRISMAALARKTY